MVITMFNQFLSDTGVSKIFELSGLGTYKATLTSSGKLLVSVSSNNDRLDVCEWRQLGLLVNDTDINYFNIYVLDGTNLVIVYTTKSGLSKVAIWPGDFPLYGNKDPYRFYYGIDSGTLYMNVENRWVPVSYLSHDKMNDVGTLTHDQLENAIVGALERITSLEAAPPGSSEINFTKKEW